ncbi:MAG: hypothetical protein ACKVG7_02340 [Flavobacteriales bacterium]
MLGRIQKKIEDTYQYILEERLIKQSSKIDISSVETLCLVAGPYRNLTSLTASVAALHPNCQVLNHAKDRIFPHKKIDFFGEYSEKSFNQFMQYAILLSGSGQRGRYGGSITLSHAFDKSEVKNLFQNRYKNSLVKEDIRCLFWKEGLHLKNHLLEKEVDVLELIKHNDKIRYILPIRNPLDCAMSNQKTNLALIFNQISDQSTLQDIIKAILDEFLIYFQNQKKRIAHFFHFYEHTFDKNVLEKFCEYMSLPFDDQWCDDVIKIYNIKPSYNHSPDDINFYKKYVSEIFSEFPIERKQLLKFVE